MSAGDGNARDGTTRRGFLAGAGATAVLACGGGAAPAQEARRHGMSIFGELKYGPGFEAFDYVNRAAPKGGTLSRVSSTWAFNQNPGTFNSLNTLILSGDAPVGLERIYDSLMVRALDEPDAIYGLVAEWVETLDGGDRFRFGLREQARWHDGAPLTAEDVAFSLNTLKKEGHPLISQTLREFAGAQALEPQLVELTFSGKHSRDLPQVAASLPIVSKAYYGKRPFNRSTMDVPLGSGPYRVGDLKPGSYINYVRVEDYWARDLPVNRGQHNFQTIRYEFYRDRDVAFEAFKAGQYRFREEFTSRVWATGYDFPAMRDGRVKREELPDTTPSGAQGWFINTRRAKFADRRVREALIDAFDFEWTNRNLFYGAYERTRSYFENSPMVAEGFPSDAERELLEPWRGSVPDEVFTEPYVPPVTDGSGRDRKLFRLANNLLDAAGFRLENGRRLDAEGKPFEIEFIDDDGSLERITQPYIRNLERLGIAARFHMVDSAQLQKRLDEYDFDLVVQRYSMPPVPGEDIRRYWSSEDAGLPGSRNLSGIRSEAIDALTTKVVEAATRDDQIVAARALDRVLRAGRYWVPHWYRATHNVAYWDEFGHPSEKPRYGLAVDETWWHEGE